MIVHHPQSTGGVVYVDLVMDMKHVSNDLLPLMTILSGALTELGTGKRDYVELQQKIGSETGGIRAGTFISQMYSPDGTGKPIAKLTVRCKSMTGQVGLLFDIIGEILTDTDFNNKDRIRQLLIEERAGLESGIPTSGHSVAGGRLGLEAFGIKPEGRSSCDVAPSHIIVWNSDNRVADGMSVETLAKTSS